MSESRPPSRPGAVANRTVILVTVGIVISMCGAALALVESDRGGPGRAQAVLADSPSGDEADRAVDGDPPSADEAEPTDDPSGLGALITPTGVIVPAFGRLGDTYLIRTPCGFQSDVTGGTPLQRADVVLDPGHGGPVETGAQGANGLVEAHLNLDVATAAADLLNERGIVTVLARTGDYRVPLAIRAQIADRLDAAILISIHHNGPTPGRSERPGTEVYIQSDSSESARLGRLVWEEVTAALEGFEDVEWVATDDVGVLPVLNGDGIDAYGMIRRPTMPAVLAELGYLSNPSEAELFATPAYVDAAAAAIAEAAERWVRTDDNASWSPMPEPRSFTPSGLTGHSRDCVDPELE